MSLFDQPEFYNNYDVPDKSPRGGLTVGLVGADGTAWVPTAPPVPPADATSITADILATNQTVLLTKPSSRVTVKTDIETGTAVLYLSFDGDPATTDDFSIDPGGQFQYDGEPISRVDVLGATADGTFSIFAD